MSLDPRIRIVAERRGDAQDIRRLTAAAFAGAAHSASPVDGTGDPGEAVLVDWLRADAGWIPELSLIALDEGGAIVGHVVSTRGAVGRFPALGLGPLSVSPGRQRRGVGSALMRATLAVAQTRGEAMVALLGDPAFYGRFGFAPASRFGVAAPNPEWGDHFQLKPLASHCAEMTGAFRYAAPFDRL